MRKCIAVLTCSMSMMSILFGCGSPATATVTPLQSSPIKLPEPNSVTTVLIESDSAFAVNWDAKNPSYVTKEVLAWLSNAEPVTVSIPTVPVQGVSGGYTGPARLLLRTKEQIPYEIVPVYYSTAQRDSHGNYVTKYLDNVVEVDAGGYQTYFRSPTLYSWLKNDQWKQQFINPIQR